MTTTADLTAPSSPVAPAQRASTTLAGTRRPAGALMLYYVLRSFAAGPGLIVVLPLSWFRYRTLRYQFDNEGISVRWGILFRREVTLTYARIQDINLVSNVVERWLGLGRVRIQTASGQADAEITIEGLHDFEAVRDELYRRMRGARGLTTTGSSAVADASGMHAVVAALQEATAELRALREALERGQP